MATKKPAKTSGARRANSTPNRARAVKTRPAKAASPSHRSTTAKLTARERERKVQSALYEIAATASAVQNMDEFYAAMHRIVGGLMYAPRISIYWLYRRADRTGCHGRIMWMKWSRPPHPPASLRTHEARQLGNLVVNRAKRCMMSRQQIDGNGTEAERSIPLAQWRKIGLARRSSLDGQD